MIDEIGVWRAAKLVIEQYGDGAELHAVRLADAMLDRGDLVGQPVWLRIRRAVLQLQAAPAGPAH